MTPVEQELRVHFEELLEALRERDKKIKELERKLAVGWEEVVAQDKARAIKAEIRADGYKNTIADLVAGLDAGRARVMELEAERDYWIDQCDQQVALIAGRKP